MYRDATPGTLPDQGDKAFLHDSFTGHGFPEVSAIIPYRGASLSWWGIELKVDGNPTSAVGDQVHKDDIRVNVEEYGILIDDVATVLAATLSHEFRQACVRPIRLEIIDHALNGRAKRCST